MGNRIYRSTADVPSFRIVTEEAGKRQLQKLNFEDKIKLPREFYLGYYSKLKSTPSQKTWISQHIFAAKIRGGVKFFILDRGITNPTHAKWIQDAVNRNYGAEKVALHQKFILDNCGKVELIVEEFNTFMFRIMLDNDFSKGNSVYEAIIAIENEVNEIDLNQYETEDYYDNIFDWDEARKKIRILDEFLSPTPRQFQFFESQILLGIVTNMIYIKGGAKLAKEALKLQKYKPFQTGNIISYAKARGYRSWALENFSPYKEDHIYSSFFSSIKWDSKKVEVVGNIEEPIDLASARKLMSDSFQHCLSSKGIHLIKLPCGIGKTEYFTDKEDFTFALPTHKLIGEVSKRMKTPYIKTTELPKFEKESYNSIIKSFYENGDYEKAFAIVESISRHNNADGQKAAQYLNDKKALMEADYNGKVLLTTHASAMYSKPIHKTLIVDEDFTNSILKIGRITLSDIDKVADSTKGGIENNLRGVTKAIRGFFSNFQAGMYMRTPEIGKFDYEAYRDVAEKVSVCANIEDLINSSFIYRDSASPHTLCYIKINPLPEYENIVILSATADIELYKALYPSINIVDISNVKYRASITFNNERSFSRVSLKKNMELANAIKQESENLISFKNFSEQGVYFGNTSGYDSMKGKDITILGTPHFPEYVYKLTGLLGGLMTVEQANDAKMRYMVVEHNGLKFRFNSYELEPLRKIQLNKIESEIYQAIGRCRPLDNNCNIQLYSNFPIFHAYI